MVLKGFGLRFPIVGGSEGLWQLPLHSADKFESYGVLQAFADAAPDGCRTMECQVPRPNRDDCPKRNVRIELDLEASR